MLLTYSLCVGHHDTQAYTHNKTQQDLNPATRTEHGFYAENVADITT